MGTTAVFKPRQKWQGRAPFCDNNFMGHYFELTGAYKIWYPRFHFIWNSFQKFSKHVPECEILQAWKALKANYRDSIQSGWWNKLKYSFCKQFCRFFGVGGELACKMLTKQIQQLFSKRCGANKHHEVEAGLHANTTEMLACWTRAMLVSRRLSLYISR